jgi:uncharacterized protein (DUF302 family)
MEIKQITMERFSVTSAKSFEHVLAKVESGIGHPDMAAFGRDITAAKTYAELEQVVNKSTGPSGLMEFTRFDLGAVHRKQRGEAPKSVRLIVGNPLIMMRMLEHVPDAGSYAPVTILIDERAHGVRLSYDRMASFLSSYDNAEALETAQDLDLKVESLLTAAST